MARAGPDIAHVALAIREFDEMIPGNAALVHRVARIDLDAGIDDGDDTKALLAQVGQHFFRVGEALGIEGEAAVAVHVIDVQVNRVAGDALFTKRLRQGAHGAFRRIAPAALLVAQGPFRRQRHAPHQRGVFPDDLGQGRPGEEKIVHRPVLGAEISQAVVAGTEVKNGAVRVVEKNAVSAVFQRAEVKRVRLVQGIGAGGVLRRVGVAHHRFGAAAIQVAGFFAEAVKAFAGLQGFETSDFVAALRQAKGRVVLVQQLAVAIIKREAAGLAPDAYLEGIGFQGNRVAGFRHLRFDAGQVCMGQSVLRAVVETGLPAYGDAHRFRRNETQAHAVVAAMQQNIVVFSGETGYVTEEAVA